MPLTTKGKKILSAMEQTYKHKGGDKKAKEVFYASRNKGTIKGVDPESKTAAYVQGFLSKLAGVPAELGPEIMKLISGPNDAAKNRIKNEILSAIAAGKKMVQAENRAPRSGVSRKPRSVLQNPFVGAPWKGRINPSDMIRGGGSGNTPTRGDAAAIGFSLSSH